MVVRQDRTDGPAALEADVVEHCGGALLDVSADAGLCQCVCGQGCCGTGWKASGMVLEQIP
jgi:hypothetical protein